MLQDSDTTHDRLGWHPLSSLPEGFFRRHTSPGALYSFQQALELPAFSAGLQLYQTTLARLPIVVYRFLDDGNRERARQHPAYKVLHDLPNPCQTRNVFVRQLVRELFEHGNFYAQIRWRGNGNLIGLYPIPCGRVERIDLNVDDNGEWTKAYKLTGVEEPVPASDMIHVFIHSEDGIKGKPLLDFAAESLGLHRQVQDSATAYYQNAARPQVYVKMSAVNGPRGNEPLEAAAENFKKKYQGSKNSGEVPFMRDGEILPFPNNSATDSEIIAALASSVGDIARWFNVDPLLLGDRSNAWSNLAAANAGFYQRSIADLLDNIESELNHKLFGFESPFFCEYLVESLLRGDPVQQNAIWTAGITAGYYTRAEVRNWQNLPEIPGLDQPLYPLNQGPQMAEPTPEQPAIVPTQEEPNVAN